MGSEGLTTVASEPALCVHTMLRMPLDVIAAKVKALLLALLQVSDFLQTVPRYLHHFQHCTPTGVRRKHGAWPSRAVLPSRPPTMTKFLSGEKLRALTGPAPEWLVCKGSDATMLVLEDIALAAANTPSAFDSTHVIITRTPR